MHSVQKQNGGSNMLNQGRSNSAGPHPGFQGGNQGGYQGGRQNSYQGRQQNNYQGNNQQRNQGRHEQQPMMNNNMQGGRPLPMPIAAPQPMPNSMPMPNAAPMNAPQFTPSQDPLSADFYSKTMLIYAAIVEMNPSYKQTVGSCIFEFVTKIVGPQFAPKITGMLIDLPIAEIQRYCTNFDLFQQRVQQAQTLLQQQSVAAGAQ
jgi:hypothetical protein